jgi:hypothetical protein
MRKNAVLTLLFLITANMAFAQAKVRRLPSIINHPSFNLYAPYVSLDGDALLFVSDDGEDQSLTVSYTWRENDWATPEVLPRQVNHRLLYQNGFALSADGKKLFITSAKSPTVGGYDILVSNRVGNSWSEPDNLLLPINSKSHDGCPSVSADGSTLYFMRCETMTQTNAQNCKLFSVRKKPNGQWDEPKELPASINTGNSQSPRIMADDETLIFSSDKMGGSKGGMDLYVTRLVNGSWSTPQPLDFANTEKDDQFVSVNALGRYLLKDAPGKKTNELIEFLFPEDLRPRSMMKVEGKVTDDAGKPIPAYVTVSDLSDGKRVFTGRPGPDGSYMLYLREGAQYELAVDPEQSNVTFFTRRFDLTTDKIPQRERVNAILKPIADGDELSLENVTFEPNTAQLLPASEEELKRLTRIVKAAPEFTFEIQVMMTGFREDSIQSDPDLTEVLIDSVLAKFDDIDTLGQLYQRDTLLVDTTYHNDRTHRQADAIVQYLAAQGTEPTRFIIFGNAIPATLPEDQKLVIKAVARREH